MTQPNQDQTNYVHVHQTCDKCGGCIHECEHGVETVNTTSTTKDRAYIAAAGQKNLLSFIKDPETIKKAVEGSMDKRIANQDQAVREWMESLGFKPVYGHGRWFEELVGYKKKGISLVDYGQALFFYTICQKAEDVVSNVTAAAKSTGPVEWIEPVSSKRLYNEASMQKAEREARLDELVGMDGSKEECILADGGLQTTFYAVPYSYISARLAQLTPLQDTKQEKS